MNNKFSGVDSSINDLRTTVTNSLIHNTVALYRPSEMRVSHDKANVKEFTTFEPDARNAVTDAENITDDKTNNVGNQGWGTNNMYFTQDMMSILEHIPALLQQHFYKIQIIQTLQEEHTQEHGFNGNFLKKLRFLN